MPSLFDAIIFLQEVGFYKVLFPLLLITAVTYGILNKIKVFGDSAGINMTISVVTAFILVSATIAIDFLITLIQYMAVGATIILLVLMVFLFAGVEQKTIGEAMTQPIVYGTIITMVVVMLFIVASQTIPQIGAATEDDLVGTTVVDKALNTLFHPTLLGIIALFAVFVVAAYMITREPE